MKWYCFGGITYKQNFINIEKFYDYIYLQLYLFIIVARF